MAETPATGMPQFCATLFFCIMGENGQWADVSVVVELGVEWNGNKTDTTQCAQSPSHEPAQAKCKCPEMEGFPSEVLEYLQSTS